MAEPKRRHSRTTTKEILDLFAKKFPSMQDEQVYKDLTSQLRMVSIREREMAQIIEETNDEDNDDDDINPKFPYTGNNNTNDDIKDDIKESYSDTKTNDETITETKNDDNNNNETKLNESNNNDEIKEAKADVSELTISKAQSLNAKKKDVYGDT
eukprot:CAMPEP_0114661616 /NCGR_PEP_ID=MMETSP0191-20121206/22904_1 /TAXON_ID=126664 /ORGANISM="Sorites sp." /LENGTH=154 /DNA_ID=CAMNT_0001894773 /DNA_START=36 /DNA_END=499 /DNA_ORIENTATION=+